MKLSVSSYNKFLQCPRLYYLEKVLKYKDLTPKPWLTFGSGFGELMALVDTIGVEEAIKSIPDHITDEIKAVHAEYLIKKWELQYGKNPQPVMDVDGLPGNEFEFNVDLSHEVDDDFELIFHGFIDKVYEVDGEPRICERKTTSDPINLPSAYWNRLDFDPQIVGYSLGMSMHLGADIEHGTYEVFRKPQKAIDKLFDHKGMEVPLYREKLLTGLCEPLKRDAEMVARRGYFITQDKRDAFLSDFVNTAKQIESLTLDFEANGPNMEKWTRHHHACEMHLPCIYKPGCATDKEYEDIQYIEKED